MGLWMLGALFQQFMWRHWKVFREVLKDAVYVCKTTKNIGMIRKIFDLICVEKHKKKYTRPLYSKKRWSSVKYMFKRLTVLESEICFINEDFTHKRERRKMDSTFELLAAYGSVVSKISFWKSVNIAHSVFDFIWKCIGLCEADQSTMSRAYVCALQICMHIKYNQDCTDD